LAQASGKRSKAKSTCTPKFIAEGAMDKAEGRSGKAAAGRSSAKIMKEAAQARFENYSIPQLLMVMRYFIPTNSHFLKDFFSSALISITYSRIFWQSF